MELKAMPNVLKKFERVIKSVDLTKKEDSKEQLYTITLDRQYKVNGKDTNTITGKTVKEVRSTIRANRLLSTQSKADKASEKEKSPKKKVEAKSTASKVEPQPEVKEKKVETKSTEVSSKTKKPVEKKSK